jgi:serine/threonine protein kinase
MPETRQPKVHARAPQASGNADSSSIEGKEGHPTIKFGAELEKQVERCFRKVTSNGKLDVGGVRELRNMLMQVLGLPKHAFGRMETQLLRFDLDGDRCLDIYEVFQCVKMNLFEYSKTSGQGSHDINIPHSSQGMTGFKIGKPLGHGNQGQAYIGKTPAGEFRCIKKYCKNHIKKAAVDALQDEFNVLHNLARHPHVAFAFDIFQDSHFYFMILELYSGGDFTTMAKQYSGSSLQVDAQWWRTLFKQCFAGLAHMHANGLTHCDIKEPNLMLRDKNYQHPQVVIIDFGLVRTAACDENMICGTPGYIAPETWQFSKLYPRSDVFAMGVVMMHMFLGRVPPHHQPPANGMMPDGIFTDGCRDIREVRTATLENTPPFDEVPSRLNCFAKVLRKVLDKDADRRPCAKQVLQEL